MEIALLIALIVLVCLLLASIVILLLALRKRGSVENSDPKEAENRLRVEASLQSLHSEVQNLSASLAALKESIPLLVGKESANSMASLQESFKKQSESNGASMLAFQKALSDTLNSRVDSLSQSVSLKMDAVNKALAESTLALNQKVQDNFKDINDRVNQSLAEGFKGSSDTMGELKKQLGAIDEAQKHLQSLQEDVTNLNALLQGNQTRGAYGELQLAMLLESTFPHGKGVFYALQDDLGYQSKDGEKVRPDASLLFNLNGKVSKLCIDSKFPFADYAKLFSGESVPEEEKASLKLAFKAAIRTQYKAIAGKYIIPGLTMGYAVMFIPNDGVFAYVENEFPDLVSESRGLGVILACPSTLQAIIVVFHNAAMEAERSKNIEAINEALEGLGVEFQRFVARWDEVERSIALASKKSEALGTTVGKISRRFESISKGDVAAVSSLGENDEDPLLLKDDKK